jgi:hypothetical protein
MLLPTTTTRCKSICVALAATIDDDVTPSAVAALNIPAEAVIGQTGCAQFVASHAAPRVPLPGCNVVEDMDHSDAIGGQSVSSSTICVVISSQSLLLFLIAVVVLLMLFLIACSGGLIINANVFISYSRIEFCALCFNFPHLILHYFL